jgi:hypothetical protein
MNIQLKTELMRNSLLVVNYPTISDDDFSWIQDIRRQYDELNFRDINPHFTLVFPIIDIDRETLVSHVKQSTQCTQPFEFVIRCAVLCNDAFSRYTHVFLVPDEGYSNSETIHLAIRSAPASPSNEFGANSKSSLK